MTATIAYLETHQMIFQNVRLPRAEALEKEDGTNDLKKKKKKKKKKKPSPPIPHLLQVQQAPALPYTKVVGRPGTGSYPAPLPDPATTPAC